MNKKKTNSLAMRMRALGFGALLAMPAIPVQANVDIAQVPLFLTASVDPNLMFILDDSGSMQWEIMPENILYTYYLFPRPTGLYDSNVYDSRIVVFDDSDAMNTVVRSAYNNKIFYNPEVTYEPWSKSEGSQFPDADPSNALYNPYIPSLGGMDLTSQQSFSSWRGFGFTSSTTMNFYPITFHVYKGAGDVWSTSSYVRYQIRGENGYEKDLNGGSEASVTNFTWPGGITRTVKEERQNFANWYSYYRSRVLAARAGIGKAFSQQGEGMRVGFGAINKATSGIDGVDTTTIVSGVRPFVGTDREAFFDKLYGHPISWNGTPLRRALDAAGQYFTRSDNPGPWGNVPGTNNSASTPHLECRQNFTILMTDGYWSSLAASTTDATKDNDSSDGPTHTGPLNDPYTFKAASPFSDSRNDTLADVAMYYWKNDLRTDLDNVVPTTTLNPAFWQHMVTFGVGLGVEGSVNPKDAFDAIDDSSVIITWPDPINNTGSERIDDLLHASVNSRGGFFSASDPNAFANELSGVLSNIVARVDSSSSAAAASSATLQSDTLLYTAGFRASDWSGLMRAREIKSDGSLGVDKWNAEEKLQSRTAPRKIYTSGGTPLIWSDLSAAQQTALNQDTSGVADGRGSDRINWLRGLDATGLRDRTVSDTVKVNGVDVILNQRRLGDIINSNPLFGGKRDFGYRLLTDITTYAAFRTSTSYQNRSDAVYVAANDGMLHAFEAKTGEELFAFMPGELLQPEAGDSHARINQLMTPGYQHRYFMDGSSTYSDAHWGGSWKTVLVGSMGAGGRTVYALDITYPQNFDGTKVLWEFGYADANCTAGVTACRELGFGIGRPSIVRLVDGSWAAVFANGYNSASNKAMLFVVDLQTGKLIRTIDTGVGTAASPNGLAATTATINIHNDMKSDLVYAGDLHGNLWRFDISGKTNTWKTTALFQAMDSLGNSQPITAAPEVALNPNDKTTLMVVFGTGSYFRNQDGGSKQVQTFYGIVDAKGVSVSRSDLHAQTITWEGVETINGEAFTLREVSNTPMPKAKEKSGWYLDLIYNGVQTGERIVSKPLLLSGATRDRVRFSTLIPEPDPCAVTGGRTGFIMDLMLASGSRSSHPVYDLDGDGTIDSGDLAGGRTISGLQGGGGEELIIILDDNLQGHMYAGEEHTLVDEPATRRGRQSWRQLR